MELHAAGGQVELMPRAATGSTDRRATGDPG